MSDRDLMTETTLQDLEGGPEEMVSVDPLEEGLSDPVHDLEELVESGDLEALDRFISVLHPADLAALSRVPALSLVDERGELSDVERGEVTIGGRPGAFDHYTVTSPQGTIIYVYAAAAVVDGSWSFSYVLFSTDPDDIDIALQMLASVTFAGGN